MTYKVIFLDIDGPMIPRRAYYLADNYCKLVTVFDPVAVQLLLALIRDNGVKIVVCSTWRKHGYDDVCKLLDKNGIASNLYLHPDWCTKDLERLGGEFKREDEIAEWLERHPEISHYAILDDEKHDLDGMVHVTFSDGILWSHFLKAQKLLDVAPAR